jgi:UDP-N-acetylmuramyl pentapeptide phosphotransferase/UDP-N-acetylglucosamine-1-phosphate transferase
VLGLAGAAVAHGLYQPWGARIGHRRLRTLARLGGVLLLLGVIYGTGRWIAAGSLGDDGADGAVITAYFLLGGLLFSALGWHDRWSGRSA